MVSTTPIVVVVIVHIEPNLQAVLGLNVPPVVFQGDAHFHIPAICGFLTGGTSIGLSKAKEQSQQPVPTVYHISIPDATPKETRQQILTLLPQHHIIVRLQMNVEEKFMLDKMKAAWIYAPRDLRVGEADIPSIDDSKALIRIKTCGVCPSDVRFYTGARQSSAYPRIPGHEWAGDIVEVGKGLDGFQPGDRVVADWRAICGECYYCRRGIFNYCSNLKHGQVKGGFCEYGYAVRPNLRKIPENVSYEEASFTEPLACCLNGVNRSNIHTGDDVVVVGAGQIGLMHVQLARHLGGRVIACDLIEARLEKAKALGASDVIHYKQLNVTGSHDFTPHDFTSALKLIAHGTVNVKALISHRLPLDEIKPGFDTVAEQSGIKVMIEVGSEMS